MIPWLLVAELISRTGKPLSQLVGERIARYPASGEINREVEDARETLDTLHAHYAGDALDVDATDGYIPGVALQYPHVEYGARRPAQRREPWRRSADA
jgi:phosphomannomutase